MNPYKKHTQSKRSLHAVFLRKTGACAHRPSPLCYVFCKPFKLIIAYLRKSYVMGGIYVLQYKRGGDLNV